MGSPRASFPSRESEPLETVRGPSPPHARTGLRVFSSSRPRTATATGHFHGLQIPDTSPFPSVEGPGPGISHAWTHTSRGLLCLVPSLPAVGLGSVQGAVRGGLAPAGGRGRSARGGRVCIRGPTDGCLGRLHLPGGAALTLPPPGSVASPRAAPAGVPSHVRQRPLVQDEVDRRGAHPPRSAFPLFSLTDTCKRIS